MNRWGSFETERLRAELLRADHQGLIEEMHRDPVQMEMLGGVRTAAETAEYMARNLAHVAAHGFGVWLLRDRATDRVAGRAILRHVEVEGRAEVEVGYSLLPDFWGRGLATEIATALVQRGFAVLDCASIVAFTLPDNLRSRRVMEKLGMRYERDILHAGLPHVLYRIERGPEEPR